MKYEGWDYLDHMVGACEELFEYMQGITSCDDFEADGKTRRAATMCLLELGELFKGLSAEEKGEYPSEGWQNLIGFRNRAAHGYHQLSFKIVYSIITELMPPLHEFLKRKQQELKSDDGLAEAIDE